MRFVLLVMSLLLGGCSARISVSSQESHSTQEVLHHVHAISCSEESPSETVFILENGVIRKIGWRELPFKCDAWNGSIYWDLTIDGHGINYTDFISATSSW